MKKERVAKRASQTWAWCAFLNCGTDSGVSFCLTVAQIIRELGASKERPVGKPRLRLCPHSISPVHIASRYAGAKWRFG